MKEPVRVLDEVWGGESTHPRILLFNGGPEEARWLYHAADMDIIIFSPSVEPFF